MKGRCVGRLCVDACAGMQKKVKPAPSRLQVEAVFNEFVQLEKKTFMSEYEEGDADEGDYNNLGGHGGAPFICSALHSCSRLPSHDLTVHTD